MYLPFRKDFSPKTVRLVRLLRLARLASGPPEEDLSERHLMYPVKQQFSGNSRVVSFTHVIFHVYIV